MPKMTVKPRAENIDHLLARGPAQELNAAVNGEYFRDIVVNNAAIVPK